MTINEKIQKILDEGFALPFVEYYSHEASDCFKILNPYTKYKQDKRVLCKVSDGFERAVDITLERMADWKLDVLAIKY